MSIKLPSALKVSGAVVDTAAAPVVGFKIRAKLLAPDGATVSTVLSGGAPIEATTGADGGFSLTINDSTVITELVLQGFALLFKSAADDAPNTLDSGLSRMTPLHLNGRQSVQAVLEWQPGLAGDITKPAISAKLRVISVFRDGERQPAPLVVIGRVEGSQGLPIGDLTVTASLIVPGTGQRVEFPQPDNRPASDTSGPDGSFQITIGRAGDLIPYQPYSAYGIRFTARLAHSPDQSTETAVAMASLSYVCPTEATVVKLRWDAQPAASPKLVVVCVHRNGIPCKPDEGTLKALGQLVDSSSQPLVGHRVQVQAGAGSQSMGEVRTNAQGFFALPHPWPLAVAAADASLQWKLQVLDPSGRQIATGVTIAQDGLVDEALPVKLTISAPTDTSPTIAQLLGALTKTIDTKTQTALDSAKIKSLQDVLNNNGLHALKGTAAADEPALTQIEQAADLWSLLPSTVTAANAVSYLATWLNKGILGTTDLGNLPRATGTAALKDQLGHFAAAQTHAVAVARNNLLNFLLFGERIDAARQGVAGMALRGQRLSGAPLLGTLLSADTQQSCSCEECQTAVSPNAYLMDLIRYAYFRVQNAGAAITVEALQALFFQPFADLPASCASLKQPVLTTRLAIELLRAYGATITLPSELTAALANNEAGYRQQAYDAILSQLGTSRTELRLAAGNADQLSALADRLSVPSATEVQKLLLTSAELADETLMESRFGLRSSKRAALDSGQPSPELLGWRLQRLHAAWVTQDSPTVFPSMIPIIDPDVLDFSNLRQGWNGTADSTVLWTTRRAAVDAQLANIAKSRALAVGAAVMTITQPLVTTPSEDQRWAAYLTVSLSESEIQSMAATLPLDQQDQAKLAAAEQKVLSAKLARGGAGPLSAAELATIMAIINYTGTALTQKIQDSAQAWVDLQFNSLTPVTGTAISTIAAWSVIQGVLKGTDFSRTLTAVTQDLARFNFAMDSFLRAFDLRLKLKNQGFRAATADDWAELDAIFVSIWKAGQVASWLTAEQTKNIKVTSGLFWQSPDQPAQRKWLGSQDRYQQWLAALQSALSEPIIIPGLINTSALLSTASTDPVYSLFFQRAVWLSNAAQGLQSARTAVEAAVTGQLALFDDKVLAAALLTPKTSSPAMLWYEPDQLQAAYDKGTMSAARLGQLLLDRNGFQAIFALRSLIRDGKVATDEEWNPAELALLSAELQQQYGTWRTEEAAAGISLSPLFFQLPAPQPLTFPPQPSSDGASSPLFTKVEVQKWRTVLSDRIAQEANARQAQADLIDQVEQAVLGNLRDALLIYGEAAGFLGLSATAALSDRLLFDFSDSPTNKTTRISQAIASLQLLLFSLRTGNLFRLRTMGTAALYPALTLEAEHFDAEWQWLGAYGSWRSALFIFMYPENLLFPTLRNTSEQSQPFKDLTQALRAGGPVTPERVLALGKQYDAYYIDVGSIEVSATCQVTLPAANTAQSSAVTTPSTQDIMLLFGAVPFGGQAYWSSRTLDATVNATQSLWNPIPGWSRVQQILGAVPSYSNTGKHRVSVIAQVLDDQGNQKLQVQNLDLNQLSQGPSAWGSGAKDLADFPTSSYGSSVRPSVVVEQVSLLDIQNRVTPRPPHLYVGVPQKPEPNDNHIVYTDVYRRPLNDEATGWAGSDWKNYLCDRVTDCYPLVAGFTIDNFSVADSPTRGYHFLAQIANQGQAFSKLFNTYYKGSNGIDLSATWNLGVSTGVAVIGAPDFTGGTRYVLLFGTGGIQQLSYLNIITGFTNIAVSYSGSYIDTVPRCSETQVAVSGTAVTVALAAYATGASTFTTLDLSLSPPTPSLTRTDYSQLTLFYTPGGSGRPLAANEDSLVLKLQNAYDWTSNPSAPAMLAQVYEARFAVPVHIASQLQQAGYYREALDWYRTVYDHSIHEAALEPNYGDLRKIYYGLVVEETEPSDGYQRTQRWIEDPFNPHAVAALRQNSYTRFTLQTIVGCLLDYADSEFASDTAESIPQARALYLEALQWADAPELAPPLSCPAVVAQIDFSFVPNDWLGTTQQLQAALTDAMGVLSPAASSQLQAAVLTALKDTATAKLGDRFAKAFSAVRSAVAAAPKPLKLTEAFKADRRVRQAAQRSLLSVPEWQRTDSLLRRQVGRRFRDAMSGLTGVSGSSLMRDDSLKLDWLTKPVRSRAATMDPGKRTPILVQPASAVSRSFQQHFRWEPLGASSSGLAGQQLMAAPSQALALVDAQAVQFIPTSAVGFCIPPNPVPNALRLRGQLNLYKLRSGRNISGLQRQLDFYAAPTDAQTGLPSFTSNGGLALASGSRVGPTEFRYSVLIERARRQVAVAAQFESQLLQALEQADNQRENLLRARNELEAQQATLNLKNLEIQEARLGVTLVQVQQQRNLQVQTYYENLLNEGVSDLEKAALGLLSIGAILQGVGAGLNAVAGLSLIGAGLTFAQGLSALASAATGAAGVLSTLSQILTMQASFERRRQDWQQQHTLAGFDAQGLDIQFQQANVNVQIRQEESNITDLQVRHAQSVVDFLVTKFTNAELFEWMSRILQGLYSAQLQQATAAARMAQQQLSFDLLQSIDLIQSDYWTVPIDNAAPSDAISPATSGPDRKGLTGAERLQADIEQLDEVAQKQTTRKLQLTRTISLATSYPGDFQRLKETGEMWFETPEKDFDLEFPGHYFRRIRRVRVSVVALVPVARGIRATLRNIGPSRIVVPGTSGFETQVLPPGNDEVSYTAPQNSTGLFDLDIQPELNLPFEGVGADSLWHFEMPMPSNPMDFASIADVQVTLEYTALSSADYRAELIADPVKLPRTLSAVRVFSFRDELVDQWYALHNAPPAPADLRATFSVDDSDFPRGISNIRVRRLTLYMPITPDAAGVTVDLSKDSLSRQIGLAFGADAAPAVQALTSDSLIAAQSAADPWFRQLPARTLSPFGAWTLVLPATQTILDLLRADQVKDILFAISYEADLPDWPTGLRPKRALF